MAECTKGLYHNDHGAMRQTNTHNIMSHLHSIISSSRLHHHRAIPSFPIFPGAICSDWHCCRLVHLLHRQQQQFHDPPSIIPSRQGTNVSKYACPLIDTLLLRLRHTLQQRQHTLAANQTDMLLDPAEAAASDRATSASKYHHLNSLRTFDKRPFLLRLIYSYAQRSTWHR